VVRALRQAASPLYGAFDQFKNHLQIHYFDHLRGGNDNFSSKLDAELEKNGGK
jgi:hypothetical protein